MCSFFGLIAGMVGASAIGLIDPARVAAIGQVAWIALPRPAFLQIGFDAGLMPALLAAGFALRDRVLRLSGLALFLICTLKLFFWDLRNLETLPRIVSFIVLGLLLVTVSWIYTRFRDQVQRFL